MEKNTKSSWDLFNEMFKVGDEVIIITAEGKYEWGKIEIVHGGVVLKRSQQKGKFWEWEDISFMCHEGFPVRKLPPSSSDKYVEKLLEGGKFKDLQTTIRKALMNQPCEICGEPTSNDEINPFSEKCNNCRPTRSYRGGDPWQIEGVLSRIYNVGNCTKYPYWCNHEFEEVIVMTDKNGLGGVKI